MLAGLRRQPTPTRCLHGLAPQVSKQVLMVSMAQVRLRPSRYGLISSMLPTALDWQVGPMSQQWEMPGLQARPSN